MTCETTNPRTVEAENTSLRRVVEAWVALDIEHEIGLIRQDDYDRAYAILRRQARMAIKRRPLGGTS